MKNKSNARWLTKAIKTKMKKAPSGATSKTNE
jgi:hypothetical protein